MSEHLVQQPPSVALHMCVWEVGHMPPLGGGGKGPETERPADMCSKPHPKPPAQHQQGSLKGKLLNSQSPPSPTLQSPRGLCKDHSLSTPPGIRPSRPAMKATMAAKEAPDATMILAPVAWTR